MTSFKNMMDDWMCMYTLSMHMIKLIYVYVFLDKLRDLLIKGFDQIRMQGISKFAHIHV